MAALFAVVGLGASCTSESTRAQLVGFVELGTLGADGPEVRAAWLESDGATEMAEALEDAADADTGGLDDDQLDEALAGLDHRPAAGHRGVAFILTGCAETSAELTIDGSVISADLVERGGTVTMCDVAVEFLVVFEIPEAAIPDDPRFDR
jgi:hypothetical protein